AGAGAEDIGSGSNPLLGGGLALAGAMAVAVYLVIGRTVRAKLSLLPYIWLVYGVAAVFLTVLLPVTGTPLTGYSPDGYLWILVLALVPQLIGHSSFNYALRYVSATYVGVATQLEPISSAIAAFILLGEVPLELQIYGSGLVLVGVTLATLGQRRSQQTQPAETKAAAQINDPP
ncbi:MAG: DMT family transporter, partial [Chloroflexi bacterium]|nr:DMT family transporter [Chloroflexota bacterium]